MDMERPDPVPETSSTDVEAGSEARRGGPPGGGRERVEAVVLGQVGVDFHPAGGNEPSGDTPTFERFVGGYAANVATGLARLGVRSMIVSAVGDDGHGRYVRSWLAAENVDVSALRTHPTLRTALSFQEADDPSATVHYREPTCPDWELREHDMPVGAIRGAPIAYVTGTGLAREPSRTATLLALEPRARRPASSNRWTIFDLDWHESAWRTGAGFPMLARAVAGAAEVVIGSESEWRAADLRPLEALGLGVRLVVVKRADGAATVYDRAGERRLEAHREDGSRGGPGAEAFAAALGAALLAGAEPHDAVRRGLAASAAAAGRRRGSAGMPTLAEIENEAREEPALPTSE